MTPQPLKDTGFIERAVDILGDKWTPLILRNLAAEDCKFCELERSLYPISPRTLSQRIEKLLNRNIITKYPYSDHPPRYKYRLTPKGKELKDILQKMERWGARYA